MAGVEFGLPVFCRCARLWSYRLAGLVVEASASGAEDLGFESRLRQDFSGSSHISDFFWKKKAL